MKINPNQIDKWVKNGGFEKFKKSKPKFDTKLDKKRNKDFKKRNHE